MKIMASWFRSSRGTALGVLVGALTLGKASPYLINGLGSPNWRHNILLSSLLAAVGALIVLLFVGEGPFALPAARFDWKQVVKVFSNRGVRLANFGYFGHMWELYAMWAWLPVMIRASLAVQGSPGHLAEVTSFLVIGCGAIGCVVAGLIADRVGRTLVTSWAMAISGSCCLLIGFLFEANPVLLLLVAAIWGATVVADSAQFSTCVTELGNPQYIGTALDDSNMHWFSFDQHLNRAHSSLRQTGRLALCVCHPGARAVAGCHSHAATARSARGGENCAG